MSTHFIKLILLTRGFRVDPDWTQTLSIGIDSSILSVKLRDFRLLGSEDQRGMSY